MTTKLNIIQFSEILMIYGQTHSKLREINKLLLGHIYCAFIGVKFKKAALTELKGEKDRICCLSWMLSVFGSEIK